MPSASSRIGYAWPSVAPVEGDALEGHLVARQERGDPVRRRVESRADEPHRDLGLLGGDHLQRLQVAARQLGDAGRDRGRHRRQRVERGHVELQDAGCPCGAAARGERGAEGHRHLAEEPARSANADHTFFAVDHLGDLGAALDHHEERPLVALVGEVLARHEVDVLDRAGQVLEGRLGQGREDLDGAKRLDGDHAGDSSVTGHGSRVTSTTFRVIRRTYRRANATSTPAFRAHGEGARMPQSTVTRRRRPVGAAGARALRRSRARRSRAPGSRAVGAAR